VTIALGTDLCVICGLFLPPRRQKSPPSVRCHLVCRLLLLLSIPQLAGYLPVRLIESCAVVCISAAAHIMTASEPDFAKPIRVREGLTRHANHVGIAGLQDRFGLCKRGDAAGGYDRSGKTRGVYRALDLGHERNRSA